MLKQTLTLLATLLIATQVQSAELTNTDCIAAVVVLESRGQPFNHQLAIAQLVKHRAERYKMSECAVVSEKGQFTAYTPKVALAMKQKNHWDWQDAVAITKLSYTHRIPCKGSTHFMNKSIRHNSAKFDQVCVIGVHKFLKEKENATRNHR